MTQSRKRSSKFWRLHRTEETSTKAPSSSSSSYTLTIEVRTRFVGFSLTSQTPRISGVTWNHFHKQSIAVRRTTSFRKPNRVHTAVCFTAVSYWPQKWSALRQCSTLQCVLPLAVPRDNNCALKQLHCGTTANTVWRAATSSSTPLFFGEGKNWKSARAPQDNLCYANGDDDLLSTSGTK